MYNLLLGPILKEIWLFYLTARHIVCSDIYIFVTAFQMEFLNGCFSFDTGTVNTELEDFVKLVLTKLTLCS